MKKMVEEFKEFAIKGNAVDLAVGVVIGAAFGTVVKSLVDDIINPVIGLLTGGVDFSDKAIVLKEATEATAQVAINYGMFINALINFLIIAWAIFMVVKAMNNLQKKSEEEPKEEKVPEPSQEVQLLMEIRDNLKK